jgi:hypothetical protein
MVSEATQSLLYSLLVSIGTLCGVSKANKCGDRYIAIVRYWEVCDSRA